MRGRWRGRVEVGMGNLVTNGDLDGDGGTSSLGISSENGSVNGPSVGEKVDPLQ